MKTRVVPIILVPGVMGTRLDFPTKRAKWDPDSKLAMSGWVTASPEWKRDRLDYRTKAKIIDEDKEKGWGTVASKFYHDFLKFLEGKKFSSVTCPVYAIGYDWRQSCWDTASYLEIKIDRVLEITKSQRAIIVTHSMGGLVTRSSLDKHSALHKKVLGVIHIVQPVAGAPVLYRRIFTGMMSNYDDGYFFSKILGNTPYSFLKVLSVIRGAFQLLPTHQYRYLPHELPPENVLEHLHGPWESPEVGSKDKQGRTVYPHGISQKFLDDMSPPGLFNRSIHGSKDKKADSATKEDIRKCIGNAYELHEELGLSMHENTWAIYSSGLETDVAILWEPKAPDDPKKKVKEYRQKEGDGTVPDESAAKLFTSTIEATVKNAKKGNYRQFKATGVEHGKVLDSNTVRDVTTTLIGRILNESK